MSNRSSGFRFWPGDDGFRSTAAVLQQSESNEIVIDITGQF
jgi:hypothetical protein